jgi:hypothetical protein
MPRTRLVWHLFAGWCALVGLVLAGFAWVASVQMAALANQAQRQRLADVAASLATDAATAGGDLDPVLFETRARVVRAAVGIEAELLTTAGDPVGGTHPSAAPSGDTADVAEARRGRVATGGRFDAATGRRFLSLAVPHGPAGKPTAIIHVVADTTAADRGLTESLGRLAAGCVACAAAAVAGRPGRWRNSAPRPAGWLPETSRPRCLPRTSPSWPVWPTPSADFASNSSNGA